MIFSYKYDDLNWNLNKNITNYFALQTICYYFFLLITVGHEKRGMVNSYKYNFNSYKRNIKKLILKDSFNSYKN
jgi:hypothetical protein